MTKYEKIKLLPKLMKQSVREDKTEFFHFTNEASEELKSLYLEHYEVRDIDYITFAKACDIMSDIYDDLDLNNEEGSVDDEIYERACDSASYYTEDRLSYLNIWNQDEVTEILKSGVDDISTACAIWYDRQVEQACFIINKWINAE